MHRVTFPVGLTSVHSGFGFGVFDFDVEVVVDVAVAFAFKKTTQKEFAEFKLVRVLV